MGVGNVFQSGKSGMTTAKAGIATAGHNISNASTEGFSRQRVSSEANVGKQLAGSGTVPFIGEGSKLSRIERINDQYLEKQLREGHRDLSFHEEKSVFLGQVEDVFNEMNGEGLNRIVSRFFNDFRKLSNEPTSEAIRQSLRESSQAMVNDFKRLHNETEAVRGHIDSRIEGHLTELNNYAKDLAELNAKIANAEIQNNQANDLQDRRDLILQKMGSFAELAMHKDEKGMYNVEIKGVGPIVTGVNIQAFHFGKHKADEENGSPENSLQISRSPFAPNYITHSLKGGKLGALIETRDKTISTVLNRLDEMAHGIANSVNELHERGFTLDGETNIQFFKPMVGMRGAAQQLALSDHVLDSTNNIAVALQPDAPSDNRNALAIANLQGIHLMNNGRTTFDDYFNSIVSDVGVTSARNNEALGQQKGILAQLNKVREQVSGVSIDEETTNLMQFQHAFDASAKVIKTADEMLSTILALKN